MMQRNVVERIQTPPVVTLCLPAGDDDSIGFAWRCTWESVEGAVVAEAGATYAFTRMALDKFVESFKLIVDPSRPQLYHRPTSIKLVQVGKDLFDDLIFETTGVIHHQHGFHPNDLEAFSLEFA